jgi:segregation and condensation protein A
LENLKTTDSLFFTQLFNRKEGRHGVVVSFLAILELSKEGLIAIVEGATIAELGICATSAAITGRKKT